jgi:hypothetical protein
MNNQSTALTETTLDRKRVGDMKIDRFAGLTFAEYREAIEFAKIMCQARHSIPAYLKQNVGDCLAILTQALRWRLEPYWLAQHSYIARDNNDSLIVYDAAVYAAIVLSVAPIKSRPRYSYQEDGDNRRCTVTATFVGETEAHSYTTPPLSKCRPPHNDRGQIKGSPLWERDADQQLGYYAVRNWGRRHCPDILGGVYDRDEFETISQDGATFERVVNPLGDDEGNGAPVGLADGSHHRSGSTGGTVVLERERATVPTSKVPAGSGSKAAHDGPAGNGAAAPGWGDGEGAAATSQQQQASSAAGEATTTPANHDRFPEPWIKRTGAEYVAYAIAWIGRAKSIDEINTRYRAERTIRNGLCSALDEDQLAALLKAKAGAEARFKP